MKKMFKLLKTYLVIAFVLSFIIVIYLIAQMVRSNTLPTINLFYICKVIFSLLTITVGLIGGLAIFDFLIVKSVTLLFKEFKYADKSGRICLVIGLILMLFQKIGEWTR
ncbi:hypothetical protein [Clostridium sp.]|uniref:hypothetical protein n=1 Tax=Clostridium sp. TaxID=1506 RepID=UPI00261ECF69|nr:hypothetical protein [uncultured Clostridium sp.]